jgi:hypothetical protein
MNTTPIMILDLRRLAALDCLWVSAEGKEKATSNPGSYRTVAG